MIGAQSTTHCFLTYQCLQYWAIPVFTLILSAKSIPHRCPCGISVAIFGISYKRRSTSLCSKLTDNVGFLCLRNWRGRQWFKVSNVYFSFICEFKYQVCVCVFLVRTKGILWYHNCFTFLNFLVLLIYMYNVRKRMNQWGSVGTEKSQQSGPQFQWETWQASFPTRTMDPQVGIFLSPILFIPHQNYSI